MSMDIRSFFTTISKKTGTSAKPSDDKKKSNDKDKVKKRQKSSSSSIEDVIPGTPDVGIKKTKKDKPDVKRRRIVTLSDSDSDKEKSPKKHKTDTSKKKNGSKKEIISDSESDTEKKNIKNKLGQEKKEFNKEKKELFNKEKKKEEAKPKKTVNLFDAFGNEPVKQTKVVQPKPKTELNIHDDDDFEKTLLDLDETALVQSTPSKPEKSIVKCSPNNDKQEITNEPENNSTPLKPKKSPLKSYDSPATSTPSSTPSRKRKASETDDSGNQDLERYEKKKYSAMLYQKYLNRSGPVNPGSKWIPKGKENCLNNESFIITGVLESLTREDAENLIVEHGGKCVKSISGKTKYMVLGDDAGPSKLEKAKKLGTKILSEDELIDLICTKSGIKNKNKIVKNESQEDKNKQDKEESPKHPSKKINLSNLKKDTSSTSTKHEIKKEKQEFKKESPKKIEIKKEVKLEKPDDDEIPSVTVKKETVPKPTIKKEPSKKPVMPKIEPPTPVSDTQLAWVDKYKPTEMKHIIGQQTDSSNAKKLYKWLSNWFKNHDGKTKLVKPSPWAKNDDGAYFKAALLSGPPGVGKTTTANVVSRELGFDVVEYNASDTRSKKMLGEEISQLLKTRSLAGYFKDGSAPTNKHVLLMDEVDGMSGNEDRGGMQELINLIKTSNIPIVCMCNDRQHPKVRSLANYCFDLRFSKPRLEQIKGAMMSVCFKEEIDISPDALNEVIVGSGMDIRQILNNLSMWSSKDGKLSKESAKKDASVAVKDVKLGPWEVIRKVFSETDQKDMSINDKYGLFFYDYSINPLFVQENYLQVKPNCPREEYLRRAATTADSLSMGDLVDSKIRTDQCWSLLDSQALFCSVIPGNCMSGHMAGQINFPGWLGKNSKGNKFKRMISELQAHMRTSISGGSQAVNLDYLSHIYRALVEPLAKEGMDGIPKSLAIMQEYHLMREDLANITELVHWPRSKDLFKNVEPKVKAAFTRAYNKDVVLPYAVAAVPVKKRRGGDEEDLYGEEENEESEEEENDKIDDNPMIKVKKPSAKDSKGTGKEAKASVKGKESRGKGTRGKRAK